LFTIDIPVTPAEANAGLDHRYQVAKVVTDAGVNGYSFAGAPERMLGDVKKLLVGRDLFNVEGHLKGGLGRWGGVEHAVWDAIGKIASQPVYKLLGGSRDRVRAYLTCVWKGPADQQQVPFRDQVEMAVRIKKAGFKGMKIRAWRPNPMDDVEVCRQIIAANGKDFFLMFDRTAHMPVSMANQKLWDFETGLKVARGLQEAGAYWLEEPFARDWISRRLCVACSFYRVVGSVRTEVVCHSKHFLRWISELRNTAVAGPKARCADRCLVCHWHCGNELHHHDSPPPQKPRSGPHDG